MFNAASVCIHGQGFRSESVVRNNDQTRAFRLNVLNCTVLRAQVIDSVCVQSGFEPEIGAVSFVTFHSDFSTHQFYKALADRQTKSCSCCLSPAFAGLTEWQKEVLFCVLGQTAARIN